MRGFLRTLVGAIVVFALALAIWKIFGGDVGGFFEAVWAFLYSIIEGVSNVFVEIYRTFFGSK